MLPLVHSHRRNVAIALELALFKGEMGTWPRELQLRRGSPGIYWAEQVRLSTAMREQNIHRLPSRTSPTLAPVQCSKPIAERPSSLADCPWLGHEPVFD
mmetsp:Transcript_20557/g.52304  ORF Transcript_20557/g.52304 Transcript_20557/m.52304 type:complete len:99 (-) Transcript_20557:220-516(-)